jgi:hypothetical protein
MIQEKLVKQTQKQELPFLPSAHAPKLFFFCAYAPQRWLFIPTSVCPHRARNKIIHLFGEGDPQTAINVKDGQDGRECIIIGPRALVMKRYQLIIFFLYTVYIIFLLLQQSENDYGCVSLPPWGGPGTASAQLEAEKCRMPSALSVPLTGPKAKTTARLCAVVDTLVGEKVPGAGTPPPVFVSFAKAC